MRSSVAVCQVACVSWLSLVGGCLDAPEVVVQTEHFEVAPDFDYPICAGTLTALEDQLEFVQSALWPTLPAEERIQFYWITRNIEEWCGEGRQGCFWPGTRVLVGDPSSAMHEIVHVVIDAPAQSNLFVEEAIAELYSGVGVYHRPDKGRRASPSEQLAIDRGSYAEGELDYVVARHFLSYVHARHGKRGVRTLARAVRSQEPPEQMRRIFENMFGVGFDRIETGYEQSSRRYYAGIREATVAEIDSVSTVTPVHLDCSQVDTHGPLYDGEPGMYQTRRFEAPGYLGMEVSLRGPSSARVLILPAPSAEHHTGSLDYEYPAGGDVLHAIQGDEPPELLLLDPGAYLFVYETPDYDAVTLELTTRVLTVVPEDEG